jgi:hypothetical protein
MSLLSCQSANKPQPASAPAKQAERTLMKTDNLQKVYLDETPKALASAAQQKTKLHVTGNLPSGAYKYDHTQVEVKGRVIEITPWAQYDPDVMAIQMLIPFADSVEVGPLAPGEYEVRYHARSGVQATKLEVK